MQTIVGRREAEEAPPGLYVYLPGSIFHHSTATQTDGVKRNSKNEKKISEFLRTSVDTGLPSRPRCQQVKQDEPRKRFHKSLQHRLSSPLAESACTATTIRLTTTTKAAHITVTMVDHNLVLSPTSSHRTMVSTGTVCCPLGARCTTGGCHHRVVPGRPRRHATTRATHRPRLTPRNQPGIRDN